MPMLLVSSGVASPTISSRYANFRLSLLISLEIDCFHSRWTRNICIAGLDRRAGYATASENQAWVNFEIRDPYITN